MSPLWLALHAAAWAAPEEAPPAETTPSQAEEDALFGGGGEVTPAADTLVPPADAAPLLTGDRDGDVLSGAGIDQAGMLDKLLLADDRLTVGGQLYLRANLSAPVEPELEDVTLSTPNLLDLFLDGRPNDRVRAFAQARLAHDASISADGVNTFGQTVQRSKVTLDQAWLKFDIGRRLYVTAGQQRIKWGAGRFWNPTDFMNQQKLDALAAYDERTGVGLVKLHFPLEDIGTNLYLVGNIDGADHLDEVGGALRAEVLLGNTELSTTAALRKDQPTRLGLDLSSGLWIFDVHAEGAVQHGNTQPFYEGELDLEGFQFPETVSREDDWIPQVNAGAEVTFKYSDQDTFSVGAEYFFNDAGYDDKGIYPWLLFGESVTCAVDNLADAAAAEACVEQAGSQYTPFYVGRQYAAVYGYVPNPGAWNHTSFTVSGIMNLSDRSGVVRIDHSVTVLTYLTVNTYVSGRVGEAGGEFKYSLSIPAVPGVSGLEEGFDIAAPLGEVGVGARLKF